jgi:hypothetical protein
VKKLGVILVLLFLMGTSLAAVVSAQTITVTKPYDFPSEPYCTGKTYPITWTKSGTMPDTVKITLRNEASTAEVLVIADPAPNNGTYQWTIPASLADGKYVVRVKAKGAAVYGDSQASTMVTCPAIRITSPHEGETWQETITYTITWDVIGTLQNGSKIELLDASGKVARPIADHIGNQGGYAWPVPGNLTFGTYYLKISATAIVLGQHLTIQDVKKVNIALKKIQVPVPVKK